MMSPEEDVSQLYDVQREFGEQDQQAPVVDEVKEFGQIQKQSLLDHEMAEMSPVEKMSYLQSQMHFDESMKCIADSEELQKLLTSPLYAEELLGNQIQEREVSAQTSHSSEDQKHYNVKNRRTKCGVLCSETLIGQIWVELCLKAIKIKQDQI